MTDPSTILKLDRARREAMLRADATALAAMFADDFMWIHGNALVDTKEGMLDVLGGGPGKPTFLAIDCTEETVRFCGGVAILSTVTAIEAEAAGERRAFQGRDTIVWAPVGDDWKAVHYQITFFPSSALSGVS